MKEEELNGISYRSSCYLLESVLLDVRMDLLELDIVLNLPWEVGMQ